jgi:hypothetical protein
VLVQGAAAGGPGTTVGLQLRRDALHFFDPASEKRIV